MKPIINLLFIFLITSNCTAQKEDHVWLYGYASGDIIIEEFKLDTTWGGTNIDFNYDPPKIYYDSVRVWDFHGTNSSICDDSGQLLVYSNGQAVYNGEHGIVEDTINYNPQWDNWSFYVGYEPFAEDTLVNYGLPTIQGALILPIPTMDSLYYIFYSEFDLGLLFFTGMYYSIIDMKSNNGHGSVVLRDQPLLIDSIGGGVMNAVKHANGRDWWLIFTGRDNQKLHRFLIGPNGIHDYGYQLIGTSFLHTSGQLYFSPDGSKVASNSAKGFGEQGANVVIMDFDRSTGIFSNKVIDLLSIYGLSLGLSFSLNNQYLYASNDSNIYQYDLHALDIIDSRVSVAKYDGFLYIYPGEGMFASPTTLGWMGLAPDGKIYVSSGSAGNRKMHVINNPNEYGTDCNVQQHSIHLPTSYARGIPNFPNYRLGPLDGSNADTLDIDNHPIAKYRYNQDKNEDFLIHFSDLSYFDPHDYHWDFGDGKESAEHNPSHVFEGSDLYEVCLTVSNDYDTHTSCRSIYIGPVAVIEAENKIDISLFPNPVRDNLQLSFHNYIPIDASIHLYDVQGHLITKEILQAGSNNLDLSSLKQGHYLYSIFDSGQSINNGKLVKVKLKI